jgi:hypothetical protein
MIPRRRLIRLLPGYKIRPMSWDIDRLTRFVYFFKLRERKRQLLHDRTYRVDMTPRKMRR